MPVSILVLLESGLGGLYWFSCIWRLVVSILVLLESGLGVVLFLIFLFLFLCFNPCSAGIRSGSRKWCNARHRLLWFQSLFCWNQVWEPELPHLPRIAPYVSILVLLESGLGDPNMTGVSFASLGFNPCSAGIRSGSFVHFVRLLFLSGVSILVLLESGLGGRKPCAATSTKSFQSLFCWNQVWELFEHDLALFGAFVSILVLLESGLGAGVSYSIPAAPARFNPCSAGIRSGRQMEAEIIYKLSQFQSLFCWNQVWEKTLGKSMWQWTEVSILVLLESGLGVTSRRPGQFVGISFNPCSAGIRSGRWFLLLFLTF